MKPSTKTGTDVLISSHQAKTPKRPKAERPTMTPITTKDLDNSGKINAAALMRRRPPFNPKEVSDRLDREFRALEAQEEGK
jgi:hypothetical protein